MLHNVSIRKPFFTALTIVFSSLLTAQVTIKERVEISPKPPVSRASIEEAVLLADDPNPGGPAHVLVMHPCTVTVDATIEMEHSTGYPSSDLYVKTLIGGSIAWYNGHNISPPSEGSLPITFPAACVSIPIALESTWESPDIRSTNKTVSSNLATIVINGVLSGHNYTVTAHIQAVYDGSYDLATMEMSIDTTRLTQCQMTTTVHWNLRNTKGDVYNGLNCFAPGIQAAVKVESDRDVQLDYLGKLTKEFSAPNGFTGVPVIWFYHGEVGNSTATITLSVLDRSETRTISLEVDTVVTGLEFAEVPPTLVHMLKAPITVRGKGCGGSGSAPLPDGAAVDLDVTLGPNWGFLRDPETGQQGVQLHGLKAKQGCVKVEYWAWGDNPSKWEAVTIRASSGTKTAERTIQINATDLRVALGRQEINYGDTTKVVVDQVKEGPGEDEWIYTPLPPTWPVMYEIVDVPRAGYFYTADSSADGSPLVGTYPEARFYAKDTVTASDSAALLIMVTAVEPQGDVWKVTNQDRSKQQQVNAKVTGASKQGTGGGVVQEAWQPPDLGRGVYHYGNAQLVVKKKEALDHFKVWFEKDTIAFTESSKIYVQAKDAHDADIALDESKLLIISVETNQDYGTFIDKNGDTLKTTPVKLENIPYGDVKAGLIRFAAVRKNPDTVVTCKTSVALQSEVTKNSDSTIVVVEQTLRIVMSEPRQVRPSIPTEDGDTARVRQRKKAFEVKVTRGGKPVVHHSFRLSSIYMDTTGGHDHDTTRQVRRPQNDDNYGYFLTGQSTNHRWPLDTVTSSEGKFSVIYYASIFGDSMRIIVSSNDSSKMNFLRDSVTIVEKVDSLQLLRDGADYDLIGGTCQHHGPPYSLTEDNNHWATDSTMIRLQRIARAWHEKFPLELILQINDISLHYGGKFDVEGKWANAHERHRLGNSVDLRTELKYFDKHNVFHERQGIPVRSPRSESLNYPTGEINKKSKLIKNPKFEQICADHHGTAQIHNQNTSNEHYHVEFSN